MICTNCGKTIPDGLEKCPECGAELAAEVKTEASAENVKADIAEAVRSTIESKPLYKAAGIDPQRPVRKLDDERPEKEKRRTAPAVKALIWIAAVLILAAAVAVGIRHISKAGKSEDVPDVSDTSEVNEDLDAQTENKPEDKPQNEDKPVQVKPQYDILGTWRWESEADGCRDTYWVFDNNGKLDIYLVGFSYDFDWPAKYDYDRSSYVLSLTNEAMGLAWIDENTFACGLGKAYRIDFTEIPEDAVNVAELEVDQPPEDDQPKEDPYLLPNSNSAYLKKEDLDALDPEMLRFARNEIFARHGRMFDDKSLQDYYNEQSWYNGYIRPSNFDSSVLNDYERYNVAYIGKYEESLGR